jgi:hypothetical protein
VYAGQDGTWLLTISAVCSGQGLAASRIKARNLALIRLAGEHPAELDAYLSFELEELGIGVPAVRRA